MNKYKNNILNKIVSITLLSILLFSIAVIFIYEHSKEEEINKARQHIKDTIYHIKATRQYVSEEQKKEVYNLQHQNIISKDYFNPKLLSSTYSAKSVNKYYNKFQKELNHSPILVKFSAPNPRNPENFATKEEIEILQKFNDNKMSQYETILSKEDGDYLYLALPTKRLQPKCMKCHFTPDKAPSQLVDRYGDKAGFFEKENSIRALMSIEHSLNIPYQNAINKTVYTSTILFVILLIIISITIFVLNQLNRKNKQLDNLNNELESKVAKRTAQLNSSNMQLTNVLDSSNLGYWEWNLETNYLEVNDRWLEMIGMKRKEFSHQTDDWEQNVHKDDILKVYEIINDAFKNKESFITEFRMKHKNGKYVWIEASGAAVDFNEDNNPIKAYGIHKDIQKKKENESQLKHQEKIIQNQVKVNAISGMLTNIAHQWRQPLSIISTSVSGLKVTMELGGKVSNEQLNECVDIVIDNTQYLSKTIDDFTTLFNNSNQIETKSIDELFIKLQNISNGSFVSESVKCIIDIKDTLEINTDINTFIQSMINITNNSLDAFKKNHTPDTERFIFIDSYKQKNNIIIKIKDSAGGINEKIIDKIFEPYFTTKHQSIGTGIGLYMTYNVITQQLDGIIEVDNIEYEYESKKYKGSIFTITIPNKSNI